MNLKFSLKFFKLEIFSFSLEKEKDNAIETLDLDLTKEAVVAPLKEEIEEAKAPKELYKGEARPDLKELEIQYGLVEVETEHVKTNCIGCDGLTYEDDLKLCHQCGTNICSGCGNYDSSTNKNYCEDCWREI